MSLKDDIEDWVKSKNGEITGNGGYSDAKATNKYEVTGDYGYKIFLQIGEYDSEQDAESTLTDIVDEFESKFGNEVSDYEIDGDLLLPNNSVAFHIHYNLPEDN